jgi:hypothetical protein
MQALLQVVLPVFLVIGAGWATVRAGLFDTGTVDALMRFATNFAIPVLLFRAIAGLDLGQDFSWPLLATFYAGAAAGFAAGLLGGRYLFARSWEDAVVFGFAALFSNSVLLGLPIMERAYGAAALAPNYAIIAIHAPFCYAVGVTAMEIARAGAVGGVVATAGRVLRAMFRNALVLGIAAGFAVNLTPSARRHAAQPLVPAAQHLEHDQQHHRDRDQDRGHRQDRRADLFAQAGEHLPGQRLLPRRAEEQHHHHLVEGGDEGEQRARDHAGQDQRHLHLEEGAHRPRAQIGRGPRERGRSKPTSVAVTVMITKGVPSAACARPRPNRCPAGRCGVEEIHPGRRDDQRHDHRRDQDRHDRSALERHMRLRQPDRRQRAQDVEMSVATGAIKNRVPERVLPLGW